MTENSQPVTDDAHISFAKRLAHNNKDTRQAALKKLKRWLVTKSKHGTLDHGEVIKIWKGLHYSMWYSDKPLTQEALALDVSQIISLLPDVEHSVGFFDGFCETIAREWVGIDRLRLNKFYMFIKTALKCVLEFCVTNDWNDKIVSDVVQVLDVRIILNKECPDSIAVFISENILSLYSEVISDSTQTLFLTKLLMSYITVLSRTPKKDLSRVLMENLFAPFLSKSVDYKLDLTTINDHIYELATDAKILTRNRKLLYKLRNDLSMAVGGCLPSSPLGKRPVAAIEEESENISPKSDNVTESNGVEATPKKKKKKKTKKTTESVTEEIPASKLTESVDYEMAEEVAKENGNDDPEADVVDDNVALEMEATVIPVEPVVNAPVIEPIVEAPTLEENVPEPLTETSEPIDSTPSVEAPVEAAVEVPIETPVETPEVIEDSLEVIETEEAVVEDPIDEGAYKEHEDKDVVLESTPEPPLQPSSAEPIVQTETPVEPIVEETTTEEPQSDPPVAVKTPKSAKKAKKPKSGKTPKKAAKLESEEPLIPSIAEPVVEEPLPLEEVTPQLESIEEDPEVTVASPMPAKRATRKSKSGKTPKKAAVSEEIPEPTVDVLPVEEPAKRGKRKSTKGAKQPVEVPIEPVVEVTPQPEKVKRKKKTAATPTTASAKKRVRLSMENNEFFFFKKNQSLQSPTPFDGDRTPVKGVLKPSPCLTRSQARKKGGTRVKL